MKKLLVTFATLFVVAVTSMMGAVSASERYATPQKVVYHINYDGGPENKKYKGALRNIQNHINAVGKDNMRIRVVLHGNGVGVLKSAMEDQALQSTVVSLRNQGAKFRVCKNTLVGRKINYETDLFEVFEDDIVPSGVAELSYLQSLHYTYIKP